MPDRYHNSYCTSHLMLVVFFFGKLLKLSSAKDEKKIGIRLGFGANHCNGFFLCDALHKVQMVVAFYKLCKFSVGATRSGYSFERSIHAYKHTEGENEREIDTHTHCDCIKFEHSYN